MTAKQQPETGKPSLIIDGELRAWRLCITCDEYRLTEAHPITCPCGVEYGKTEMTVGSQIEMVQNESRRPTICESCGQGMSVLTKDWNPAAAEICEPCKLKHNTREQLVAQLRIVQGFGHSEPGMECEVCEIQNEIDALDGYDWRDRYAGLIDRSRSDFVVRANLTTRLAPVSTPRAVEEMNMKMGDAFPSKWIAAADLPDEGLTVTIDNFDMQDVGQDRKEKKPVLYFRERDVKALVLNKTNAKVIEQITGSDEFENWIGHKITLVPREVEFQGDTVWAVRVQLPRRQAASRVAAKAQAPPSGKVYGSGPNDLPIDESDIPF